MVPEGSTITSLRTVTLPVVKPKAARSSASAASASLSSAAEDSSKFAVGEQVRMRHAGEDWITGVVTSLQA